MTNKKSRKKDNDGDESNLGTASNKLRGNERGDVFFYGFTLLL